MTIDNLVVNISDSFRIDIEYLSFLPMQKICIIGKSGSGKSSLVNAIVGLKEYTGNISDNNSVVYTRQTSDLIEEFNVKTNVLMGGFGKKSVLSNLISIYKENVICNNILKSLGLSELKSQQVSSLSGGEKQRVMVARSLFQNGEIYFYDEPTSALDIVNSKNTIEVILEAKKACIVICIIHDIDLIKYFDRVIVLDNGKVVDDKLLNTSEVLEFEKYFN